MATTCEQTKIFTGLQFAHKNNGKIDGKKTPNIFADKLTII